MIGWRNAVAVISVAIGLVHVPRGAIAEQGSGSAAGIPAYPCSKVIENRDNDDVMLAVVQWTFGFWSGWNFSNSLQNKFEKELQGPSLTYEALKARIVAYCYEKPDEILIGAAVEIYLTLPDFEF